MKEKVKTMQFITEATLNDSFIFGMFNSSNEMQAQIIKALNNGFKLDRSYIENQIFQLEKSRMSPLISTVLDHYFNGVIELLYVKNQKITKAIPFIVHKASGGIKVSIFVSTFAVLDRDGTTLDIPVKTLYTLMESAYIAYFIQTNPMRLQRNSTIMRTLNSVYTEMIMRIVNRDYALTLQKEVHDQVAFVVSKFFLTKVAEIQNPQIAKSYAASCTLNLSDTDIEMVNDIYDRANPQTINDVINVMKQISPRMETLTIRFFIERYMNTYGQSSVLALDYLPYMFMVLSNTLLGSFIVNQPSIGDIVKNTQGSTRYYNELSKMIPKTT